MRPRLSSKSFSRGHEELLSAFHRIVDLVLIAAGHYLACFFYRDYWRSPMTSATVIALVTFNLVAEWRGLYRPWRAEPLWSELKAAFTTWLAVPTALLTVGFVTKTSATFSRAVTIGWFAGTVVLLTLWRIGERILLRYLRLQGRNTRNVAILGVTAITEQLCESLTERPWLGLRLVGVYDDRSEARRHKFAKEYCPFRGNTKDLIREARAGNLDIVYIGLPLRAESRIGEVLHALADTTATVYLTADFFIYDLLHARWQQLANIPLISIYDSPFQGVAGWLKRVEDLVLGTVILAIVAIPMLLISIAIKLTSPGPVFFRQRRFGLNGKEIRVLKFRTMTVLEDGAQIKQATRDDPRVTPLGRFLRRTSLDELPQFLQVITGQMSIVGPRPHAVAHNETYRSLIRGYMLRHKVKPGITGWAQVNGFRGETDTLDKMEQRVRYDLEYITDWYLSWDLKIILLTILGSRKKHGAY